MNEKKTKKMTDNELIDMLSDMLFESAYIIKRLLEKLDKMERFDYEKEFLEDSDEIIHLARRRKDK